MASASTSQSREGDETVSSKDTETNPRKRVHVTDDSTIEIYGVDATWTNQYRGPLSDFDGFRVQYDADIDSLIKMVARHVAEGRYSIINLSASKHALNVLCGCEIMQSEVLKGFDDALRE